MLFCAFMLLSLYAATAHGQDFVCGYGLGGEEATVTYHKDRNFYRGNSPTQKPIQVLPLFGKFKDMEVPEWMDLSSLLDRKGVGNQSSANLLNPTHKGSLAHFYNAMSYGALSLRTHDSAVVGMWFESQETSLAGHGLNTAADCDDPENPDSDIGGWSNAVKDFALDVVAAADEKVDFNNYDGDGDGRVDMIAVFTPRAFGDLCGPQGTVLEHLGHETKDDFKKDTTRKITVETIITSDHRGSFPFLVGVLAHEYGHAMGLPELYDRTNQSDDTDYPNHSAGIGYWGLMGRGNNGYMDTEGVWDGPAPLSAWSRIEVGWIAPQTVDEDDSLEIHDINSELGKVYKVQAFGGPEYFLLSNRQNTYDGTASSVGSYYDDHAPESGLLIWHIDEWTGSGIDVNINELHKRVDVECADGLWFDANPLAPSTTLTENSEEGGDNLDYWTPDDDYRMSRGGNIGDATDVWDGLTYTEFTPYTNPSTYGYDGNRQDVFLSLIHI